MSNKSRLDAFTAKHLEQWVNHRYYDDEAIAVKDKMVDFLDSLEQEVSQDWQERGWTAVFDHVFPKTTKTKTK